MYKKLVEGKKGFFFDLDGTIINTAPYWEAALEKVLKENHLSWVNPHDMYIPGVQMNTLWKRMIENEDIEVEETIEEYVKKSSKAFLEVIEDEEIEPMEGLVDLLIELKHQKNLTIALLTNAAKNETLLLLDKIGIPEAFDLIITADDVKKAKPDPEIYKTGLKKLNLRAKEVLVFEDSPTGSESAARAGLDQIIIYNERFSKSEYKGNILKFFPDFSPLPGNLDKTYFETVEEAVKVIAEIKKEKENKKEQNP